VASIRSELNAKSVEVMARNQELEKVHLVLFLVPVMLEC
jgi:hypothetical protein